MGDVYTCSPIGTRYCMLTHHVLSVGHGLMTSLVRQHASALWRSIQPFCQDAGVANMPRQHLLMHVRFVHSCFHCARLTHSQPGLYCRSVLVQHEASTASHQRCNSTCNPADSQYPELTSKACCTARNACSLLNNNLNSGNHQNHICAC